MLFAASVFIRLDQYHHGINVANLDASYHVLATVEALQANSISSTKLLPSVSFAGQFDKHIPWGATVEDKQGNYIYASFPQGGFVLPFVFFSATGVNPSIYGLMIFNLSINFITGILLLALLFLLSRELGLSKRSAQAVSLSVSAAYIFSVEALYSQGIIYWAQSPYQAVLTAQLIVLYGILKRKRLSVLMGTALAGLCVAGTLLEWTAFTANTGIILIFSVLYIRRRHKYLLAAASITAIASVVGLLAFVLPMVNEVGASNFFGILDRRFSAHNAGSTVPTSWHTFINGYLDSFGPTLLLALGLALLAMLGFATRPRLMASFAKLYVFFAILCFAMIENVIMKQHAITYTFDRLKFYLPLALILICAYSAFGRKMRLATLGMLLGCIALGLASFWGQSRVIPDTPNLDSNVEMTSQTSDPAMIVATTGYVRGYVSSTLERGVYEEIRTAAELKAVAGARGAHKATWLLGKGYENGLYQWDIAITYDYDKNTALIKFRNAGCGKESYMIQSKFFPEVHSTASDTGLIKAEKSIRRFGDCFDSVTIDLVS